MTEAEDGELGRALSCTEPAPALEIGGGCSSKAEMWVLVINTGGTIGMVPQSEGLVPKANKLAEALKKMTVLHDATYAKETQLYNRLGVDTLVLPSSNQNKRIIYTILELSPLLDSSNMTPAEWDKIAICLEANYEKYDGFVILHGTDTMAYTSSALSFMCENLGKTIILTGSQIPIYELRNDGRANLLGALLIAGQFVIPEVCLYFDNKLYRGNRVTKMDAGSFSAFSSPNLPPLANAEVDIIINWETIWRANTMKKFEIHTNMNSNVGLLRVFPGITATAVRAFLQSSMEGIVLETYGSGNAPNNCPELLELLRKATDSNVVILNCTQCLRGSVSSVYATGKMLSKNLRGEMTVVPIGTQITLKDCKFIQEIAKYLLISCKEELEAVRDALTPSLACVAAKNGDLNALKALQDMGGNLSSGDYDGRTPLHVASCEGNLKIVRHLLKSGATVYAKDRLGATPLMNAIKFRNHNVIELLRKTGAHLSRQELVNVGTELCSLAFHGDLDGLLAWHLAGVDLNQPGYDGNTPANVAKAAGHAKIIEFFNKLGS
ncbi:60 kDa lysophospholipase isoform X2 [Python bivittatus]|uniref:asparaginase n=1 Tax=Python bivittatus TaxID=176946 RepID=A0A9F5MUD6_PYTBI|nr:60 kDa lysophospholipase isoform X2 [Python bivittatus]